MHEIQLQEFLRISNIDYIYQRSNPMKGVLRYFEIPSHFALLKVIGCQGDRSRARDTFS